MHLNEQFASPLPSHTHTHQCTVQGAGLTIGSNVGYSVWLQELCGQIWPVCFYFICSEILSPICYNVTGDISLRSVLVLQKKYFL